MLLLLDRLSSVIHTNIVEVDGPALAVGSPLRDRRESDRELGIWLDYRYPNLFLLGLLLGLLFLGVVVIIVLWVVISLILDNTGIVILEDLGALLGLLGLSYLLNQLHLWGLISVLFVFGVGRFPFAP